MGYVDASTNSPATETVHKQSIDSLSLQSDYDVIEMALLEWSSAGCGHLEGVIVANEKHHEVSSSSSSSTSSETSGSPSSTFDDIEDHVDVDTCTSGDEFFEYSTETTSAPSSEDQIYDPTCFVTRIHTENWLPTYSTNDVRSFLGGWTLTSNERDLLMDLLPEGLLGGPMQR